jgi:hypothetical protein
MKFLKISLLLNKKGFRWIETDWDVKETETLYVMTRNDEDGYPIIRRHLKKDELMKIKNMIITSYKNVEYYMVFPEDKKDECKKILMDKVLETVNEIKQSVDDLLTYIK